MVMFWMVWTCPRRTVKRTGAWPSLNVSRAEPWWARLVILTSVPLEVSRAMLALPLSTRLSKPGAGSASLSLFCPVATAGQINAAHRNNVPNRICFLLEGEVGGKRPRRPGSLLDQPAAEAAGDDLARPANAHVLAEG